MFEVVPGHERGVVDTRGRPGGARGPGLVILIPVIQTMRRVDMREQVVAPGRELQGSTGRFILRL